MNNKNNNYTPYTLVKTKREGLYCLVCKPNEEHQSLAHCANPIDAKRIVACVNFCEGYSDEQLAEMGSLKNELQRISDMAEATGKVTGLLRGVGTDQWHPYDKDNKETWPKLYKDVLCFDGKRWFVAQRESDGTFYDGNERGTNKTITHYQTITPPQEEG